ncbi:MAG: exodeoxyribonuclease III [Microbacterium sp.]
MPQSLRIASVNVNGIRAAERKGFSPWLESATPDILTLQEVRAPREHLDRLLEGWHVLEEESPYKGRAGVALASRAEPVASRTMIGGEDADSQGRWLEVDFDVNGTRLTVVSAYVHSGEVDTPKQDRKWAFLDAMTTRLAELSQDGALAVVTGDLNVGHRELDIKNWRGNVKRAGFLPRERAYFDDWLCADGATWVDVGRKLSGEVDGPYTWWSNRGQAFDNDTGWRIDYQLATTPLADRATAYRVDRAPSYDARWSDHAPVVVDYAF